MELAPDTSMRITASCPPEKWEESILSYKPTPPKPRRQFYKRNGMKSITTLAVSEKK